MAALPKLTIHTDKSGRVGNDERIILTTLAVRSVAPLSRPMSVDAAGAVNRGVGQRRGSDYPRSGVAYRARFHASLAPNPATGLSIEGRYPDPLPARRVFVGEG